MELEKGGGQRTGLPITPPLLRRFRSVWSKSANSCDTKMTWAASCLAFFGFLCVGEMTAPQDGSFNSVMHLGLDDIAVDSLTLPSFVHVTIKQSKKKCRVDLFLSRTQADLCPVAANLSYLAVRGARSGPLFYFEDGCWLTRSRFVAQVWSALSAAGVDQSKYFGHSFHIGAATTAVARAIEDSVIRTLGRWESVAYHQYVLTPRQQLMGYSSVLGDTR